MCFIEYDQLTTRPAQTLKRIYDFLVEVPHTHDFDHVEQVTVEDDSVYGFKDLHLIRPTVVPQPPQWMKVYDDAVFKSPAWQSIEAVSTFWKLYANPRR